MVPETPLVPFVTALRTKTMDWSEFYEYLERESKDGSLKGNRTWVNLQGEVRRHRIQAALDELSKKFSEYCCAADCVRCLYAVPLR